MHPQSHHHRSSSHGKVKEEEEEECYLFGETSSYPTTTIAFAPPLPPPQPLEGLERSGPPPFLTKTYDIVDDPFTDRVVSWNPWSNGFVVWDAHAFSVTLLPKYFKHNNFSSFIRQLSTYGFRKVDPDRWEFANEYFLRGQKHLLRNIKRRNAPGSSSSSIHDNQQSLDPCVEVGRFGSDGEIDRLKRDKQVLVSEVVKLRQQQQNSRTCLQDMERRLKNTESKQLQTTSFLARAVRNPGFLRQLVERSDKRKGIEEALEKKKQQRRTIDRAPVHSNLCEVPDFEAADVEMLEGVVGLMGAGESSDRGNRFADDRTRNRQQQQMMWGDLMAGRGEEEELGLGLDIVPYDEDENVLIEGLEEDYNVAVLDYVYGGSQ